MKGTYTTLKAVIFDWAGTIVDHGSLAPVQVFSDVFNNHGVKLTVEEIRESMGMAKREHIAAILSLPSVRDHWTERFGAEPSIRTVDQLDAEFLEQQESAILERSELLLGVDAVMAHLRSSGMAIGSTTGYPREAAEALVEDVGNQGFGPGCLVTASDVSAGRPALGR